MFSYLSAEDKKLLWTKSSLTLQQQKGIYWLKCIRFHRPGIMRINVIPINVSGEVDSTHSIEPLAIDINVIESLEMQEVSGNSGSSKFEVLYMT